MTKKQSKPEASKDLPADVKAADLVYPKYTSKTKIAWDKLKEQGFTGDCLRFYKTTGFGWVLTTLLISNPSRRHRADATARTYGVTLDGRLVRVGLGPHVVAKCSVYVTTANWERLSKYVELWKKGMELAGNTRDRISTRRAQGQAYRSQFGWDD